MSYLVANGAIEILEDKLYFLVTRAPPSRSENHYFTIDHDLVYWNFFLDFGPLNLGQTFRFCQLLNEKLSDPALKQKRIVFYCGTHPHRQTNAATLICCWRILFQGLGPEEAFAMFEGSGARFVPFHDATPVACTYKLSILDCLRGLAKAKSFGFFDFADFDCDELEHYEKVENGDLHWICKKFIAFAGPHNEASFSPDGYCTLTPEHYIPYYKQKGVELIVRLNKPFYDKTRFTREGFAHRDMYFLDGTTPPNKILKAFMESVERTEGVVAVHCKAGLGRTGCLIGAYLMKHFRFTAAETIGWLRLCRPGMVIGPQQQYMESLQSAMWQWADAHGDQMDICDRTFKDDPPVYGQKPPARPLARWNLALDASCTDEAADQAQAQEVDSPGKRSSSRGANNNNNGSSSSGSTSDSGSGSSKSGGGSSPNGLKSPFVKGGSNGKESKLASKDSAVVAPYSPGRSRLAEMSSRAASFKASFQLSVSSYKRNEISQGDQLRLAKSSPKNKDVDGLSQALTSLRNVKI